MRYFPFLRGKQNELLAVSRLAARIVQSRRIIPIIEPVNWNSTTQKSIREFLGQSMSFLFICNPIHGTVMNTAGRLLQAMIGSSGGNSVIPALYIDHATSRRAIDEFKRTYASKLELALIYLGEPQTKIKEDDFEHHVFMPNRVRRQYRNAISPDRRVIIDDPFHRRPRNAEYPNHPEVFTDINTLGGNREKVDFGDFSIVGDHFADGGGPAHAVALHHIHFRSNSSFSLDLTHFVSDRTASAVDPTGKTLEAINHLVRALSGLTPNDTEACREYREIRRSGSSRGLGYMKRLAIQHHLEVVLHPNGLVP